MTATPAQQASYLIFVPIYLDTCLCALCYQRRLLILTFAVVGEHSIKGSLPLQHPSLELGGADTPQAEMAALPFITNGAI